MPNWAYTNDAAASTYQGSGAVQGSQSAYGFQPNIHGSAHWGVVGWVLLAVVGLILLDQGGFRFMVTAGRR